jgi:hypothetical protein
MLLLLLPLPSERVLVVVVEPNTLVVVLAALVLRSSCCCCGEDSGGVGPLLRVAAAVAAGDARVCRGDGDAKVRDGLVVLAVTRTEVEEATRSCAAT